MRVIYINLTPFKAQGILWKNEQSIGDGEWGKELQNAASWK